MHSQSQGGFDNITTEKNFDTLSCSTYKARTDYRNLSGQYPVLHRVAFSPITSVWPVVPNPLIPRF